ncbi:MAG: hypothetical protein M5U12_10060 [Verrucomicrobia bacterium]|nr:hypothetical protein [Verrucomicrobiota bacterium]
MLRIDSSNAALRLRRLTLSLGTTLAAGWAALASEHTPSQDLALGLPLGRTAYRGLQDVTALVWDGSDLVLGDADGRRIILRPDDARREE